MKILYFLLWIVLPAAVLVGYLVHSVLLGLVTAVIASLLFQLLYLWRLTRPLQRFAGSDSARCYARAVGLQSLWQQLICVLFMAVFAAVFLRGWTLLLVLALFVAYGIPIIYLMRLQPEDGNIADR